MVRTVALDTETWLLSPKGRLVPRLVCVQLCEDGIAASVWHREQARDLLWALFTDPVVEIVGHNVAFDLAVVCGAFPELMPLVWSLYDQGRVHDTGIADQLVHIADGDFRRCRYSLAETWKRHTGRTIGGKDDGWRFRYAELDAVTDLSQWPDEALRYAREDARVTWLLWQRLRDRLMPTYHDQVRAAWALHLTSAWGMRADPARVQALAARLGRDREQAAETLRLHGVLREDDTIDTKAVQEIVVESSDGEVARTPTGKVQTTDKVLADLDHPTAQALREYRSASLLTNTFLPHLVAATTAPVCPRYSVLVDSGRTSSSKPNIQQQPREGGVREAWAPRPGCVFVSADYAAAELSAVAQVCLRGFGFSRLAEQINAGMDPHLALAAHLLKIDYSEAHKRRKEPLIKRTRGLAKAANFGFWGLLSPPAFRGYAQGYGVTIDLDEAAATKRHWQAVYPESNPYFAWVKAKTRGGKAQITIPTCGFVRGGLFATEAANTLFQTTIAVGAKRALWQVARECWGADGALAGSRPVAFVHDEILLETPRERAHDAAMRLAEVMVECMRTVIPDVRCDAEPLVSEVWSKAADPVYDAAGRLVPWRLP